MKKLIFDSEKNSIIALHNHPNSTVPSLSDLRSARKYKYGLIIEHNGRIFKYAVSLDATEEQLRLADYELDILNRYLYDNSRDFKNNIDDEIGILKDFGVEFEVIR